MPTYVFPEVKAYGTKALPCPGCGRKVRRKRMFTQTESPFNKNPDGSVRTPQEIYDALSEERRAWESVPERHVACEEDIA
jgi:hypothetical protein